MRKELISAYKSSICPLGDVKVVTSTASHIMPIVTHTHLLLVLNLISSLLYSSRLFPSATCVSLSHRISISLRQFFSELYPLSSSMPTIFYWDSLPRWLTIYCVKLMIKTVYHIYSLTLSVGYDVAHFAQTLLGKHLTIYEYMGSYFKLTGCWQKWFLNNCR